MRIPHEPSDEFPQEVTLIEQLTGTNHDFGRLVEHYEEVNREIYRIESEEAPTTNEVLETAQETSPQAQGRYRRRARQA